MKPATLLYITASIMCCAVAFNQYDSYKSRHSLTQPLPKTIEAQPKGSVASLVGKPAPDFNLVSFDGSRTIKLSDYKGKPVIVTFWAAYCGWCRDEAPLFSQMQAKYARQKLQILSVVPLTASTREEISHALKTWGINYPVLISDQGAEDSYYVNWFPTTVYINPAGMVVRAEDENVKGADKLDGYVRELLK